MSKKDFDAYVNQIEDQYLEMLSELRDMEKELSEGMVSPEMYDQMKEMVAPLKINYERACYFKFILNKPRKKSKRAAYVKQNKKLIQKMEEGEVVLKENQDVLQKLKELNR